MKLFAFSDWHRRSIEPILRAIEQEEPDAVLYLGDGLDRMLSMRGDESIHPPGTGWKRWAKEEIVFHPDWAEDEGSRVFSFTLLTKGMEAVLALSKDNLEEIDRRGMVPDKLVRKLGKVVKRCVKEIETVFPGKEEFSVEARNKFGEQRGLFECIQVPVLYVNGNDEPFLYDAGTWYVAIPFLTFKKPRKRGFVFGPEPKAEPLTEWGFVPVNETPTIGLTAFEKSGETISLFGLYASPGMGSSPLNLPDRYVDIVLSHVPPRGCLDLSIRYKVEHIGSQHLRHNIERYSHKLVLCGHSHLSGGQMMRLNDTMIVNISSHDRGESLGNYAIISTSDWNVELKNVERDPEQVIRLFSVRGGHSVFRQIRDKMAETKSFDERKHLRNLSDFFAGNPTWLEAQKTLRELKAMGIGNSRLEKRVEAKERGTPIFRDYFTLDPQGCAFVDVETGSFKEGGIGKLWLIGVLLDGMVRQYEYPDQWTDFLEFLRDCRVESLASWTKYDHKVLRPLLQEAGVQLKFIDVCQRSANHMYWDAHTLDAVYVLLFPEKNLRDEDEITGWMAGVYADHLILPDNECPWCPSMNEVKQRIMKKNRTDLWRTYCISQRLYENSRDRGRKVLERIAEIYMDEYGEPLRTERVDLTVYKNTIKPIVERLVKDGVPREDIRCLVTVLNVTKRVREDILYHLGKVPNDQSD